MTPIQSMAAGPLLTEEQEAGMGKLALAGDLEARRRLVLSGSRFAISVAQRYQRQGVELDDLIQAAMIGLVRAVDTFDPTLYRWTTHAFGHIRNEIRDELKRYRPLAYGAPDGDDSLEPAERLLDLDSIQAQIPEAGLNEREQLVVRLRFDFDLTPIQSAEILGIHTNSERRILAKAIRKIQEKVA